METQTCNIDRQGIRKRQQIGMLAGVVAIITSLTYLVSGSLALISLSLLAWFVSSIGFLQGHLKFCVYFGIDGIDGSKGKQIKVSAAARRAFWLQSAKIIAYALFISFVITMGIIFLGTLVI